MLLRNGVGFGTTSQPVLSPAFRPGHLSVAAAPTGRDFRSAVFRCADLLAVPAVPGHLRVRRSARDAAGNGGVRPQQAHAEARRQVSPRTRHHRASRAASRCRKCCTVGFLLRTSLQLSPGCSALPHIRCSSFACPTFLPARLARERCRCVALLLLLLAESLAGFALRREIHVTSASDCVSAEA